MILLQIILFGVQDYSLYFSSLVENSKLLGEARSSLFSILFYSTTPKDVEVVYLTQPHLEQK